MKRRTLSRWSGYLFVLPYLVLFCTFLVYPVLSGLKLSMFRWELLSASPAKFIGLGNYREAVADPMFWKALGVTFRMMLIITPLTVLLALSLALGLNSIKKKRQTFYRAALFIPGMLTVSVVGILWRWFYNPEFGVFNAMLAPTGFRPPWLGHPLWATIAIVIMTLWWTTGGPMVTLLAGLQGVPDHYIEAAQLDGANAWQRTWCIVLPQLRPVLLFVMVMNIIGTFQIFGQTFLVTKGGPEYSTRTLVQYIYDTAFNNYRMGYAAAMSWLLFAVIGTFSMVQFRLMREK